MHERLKIVNINTKRRTVARFRHPVLVDRDDTTRRIHDRVRGIRRNSIENLAAKKQQEIVIFPVKEAESNFPQLLAEKLKTLRSNTPETRSEIAQASNLSLSTYIKIEKGQMVRFDSLGKGITYWIQKEAEEIDAPRQKKESLSSMVIEWINAACDERGENEILTRAGVSITLLKSLKIGEQVDASDLGAVLDIVLYPFKNQVTRAGIVFEPEKKQKEDTFILNSEDMSPKEVITKLGGYMEVVRKLNGLGIVHSKLAKKIGVSYAVFQNVLVGRGSVDNQQKVTQAVARVIQGGPLVTVEAEDEQRKKQEEVNWLRTFSQKGMTSRRALLLIRLNEDKSSEKYAADAGINKSGLSEAERGQLVFKEDTLNCFLEASSLGEREKQFVRLINNNRSPMTKEELKGASFGELLQYSRLLLGLSQSDLAKDFGITQPTVSSLENNRYAPNTRYVQNLVNTLGLVPQSALTELIHLKQQGDVLSDDLLERAIVEGYDRHYLFAEHMQNLPPQDISERDTYLLKEITNKKGHKGLESSLIIGSKLRRIREYTHISQERLAILLKTGQHSISQMERGMRKVKTLSAVRYLYKLGYGIHHPITQEIIDLTEDQRIAS